MAIVEEAKEMLEEAVEAVKEAAPEIKKAAKSTAKKTAAGARSQAKKVEETAKKAAQKLALKEIYIQFGGNEYKESDILEKVEEAYKAEGHRIGTIKSLELYIKPEEGFAYYVINGKNTGKVEL